MLLFLMNIQRSYCTRGSCALVVVIVVVLDCCTRGIIVHEALECRRNVDRHLPPSRVYFLPRIVSKLFVPLLLPPELQLFL